jgi:ABC-type uncharacterized transport system permease subunit
MDPRLLLIIATLGYLISSARGIYALGAKAGHSSRGNDILLFGSFLLHTGFLYIRGKAIGHCPLTNLFETVVFFSWSLVLTYIAIGSAYRMSILGAFTAPLVFLMNFLALVSPIDLPRKVPSMSAALELHASMSLLAYGALGIAALAGLVYLIQDRQLKRHEFQSWFYRLPSVGALEVVQRKVLWWGFILLTIGLLAGFQIPNEIQVDWVKLVWSGMVWLLYFILLIAPRFLRLSHKKIAWCSLAGYIFVLLTFWGINSLSQAHRFSS